MGNTERSEYRAFHSIMFFFQKVFPQLGTFSAIKLMARVHPSLIYNEYLYFINESEWRSGPTKWIVTTWFFVKQILCTLAAVGAFATKLLVVGNKLTNPHYTVLYRLANAIALLDQCM